MLGKAQTWLARYALSATVILALPLIALIMTSMLDGVMPDGMKKDVATAFSATKASSPACVAILAAPDSFSKRFEAEHVVCRCAAAKTDPRYAIDAESALGAACRVPSFAGLDVKFAWPATDADLKKVVSQDVAARFRFIVPTGLLTVLSIPIIIVSFIMLQRRRDGRAWTLVLIGVGGACAAYGYTFSDVHPLRLFLVELLLGRAAEDPAYPFLTTTTLAFALRTVDFVTTIVMVATGALFVLGAAIAARPGVEQLRSADLLRRGRRLNLVVGVGALVLALTVASGYGMLHWSSNLVEEIEKPAIQSMASSALLYWGVLWSTGMAVLAIPTSAALRMDAQLLAKTAPDETIDMVKETGLDVTLKRAASFAIAIAAPALTGPALDLLSKLASSGGG